MGLNFEVPPRFPFRLIDRNVILTPSPNPDPGLVREWRWTPDLGRPDKAELPGWEAPYEEQDDGWEASSLPGLACITLSS